MRSAADVLRSVQRLSGRLAAAESLGAVGEVMAREGRELTGAPALVLAVAERGGPRIVAAAGLEGAAAETVLSALSADAVLGATDLAAGGALDGVPLAAGLSSWASMPLVARGSRVGFLVLGWRRRRRVSGPLAQLLGAVGHQCAMALDRARIIESERERRSTAQLMAQATKLLVSALDPDEIVLRLAKLAVPRLAPWCAVYAAEGAELRRVALEIDGNPALVARARRFATVPIVADHPLALAYRSGELQMFWPVRRELVEPIYSDALATELLAAGRSFSALVVPMAVSGGAIGVMSLVSDAWGSRPDPELVRAAEALAGQAGIALAVAGRFQREHATAVVLTHALLPGDPSLPGYETASRYLPAGGTVAGDWFDVFRAGPDRFLVGAGDAGGHGIHAASLMAELRNAARGLAAAGHSPAEILQHMGWLVEETEPDGFATACYATVDPASGALDWASAGHVPPVLFDASGARFLERPLGVPLGAAAGDVPPQGALRLGRGDGLVFYTDGVVERRSADIDERLGLLVDLVAGHHERGAEALVELIIDRLCADREDDCCVLVLRRPR